MCVKIKMLLNALLLLIGNVGAEAFNDTSSEVPEEIQHAICKIATEDIEASANATIRRELKGVCTSKEVMERLDELEHRLLSDIEAIKIKLQVDEGAIVKKPQLKLLPKTSVPTEPKKPYERNLEALKSNRTVLHTTELGKSFLYFWKICDLDNILKQPPETVQSGYFVVQGNALQIALYPSHLGTHYIALELKGTTNYVPEHRFVILNRNDEKGDLSSQILGVTVSLFRVASKKLADFINDDCLIVKAIVALR